MLPWQFLNIKKSVKFEQIPIDTKLWKLDLELLESYLKNNNVKLISVFHISNITGIELPIKKITEIAHKYDVLVLLDAAQSIPHIKVDVQDLDVDFMAFSVHKAYGPTGVGVLYGKEILLKKAVPHYVGGEGIIDTSYETCTLEESPKKFEVGLQNYAGIIGAGEAISYLSKINLEKAQEYILDLNKYLTESISNMNNIEIIGPTAAEKRHGILNIKINNHNPAEIGLMLSKMSRIMVRSGVHCGHSWYHKHSLSPSLRVSIGFYNLKSELDMFINNLKTLTKN